MLHGPILAAVDHEARDRVFIRGECQHVARRQRIGEARESAAHEQRLALPVPAHEGCAIELHAGFDCHENGLESIRLQSEMRMPCYM